MAGVYQQQQTLIKGRKVKGDRVLTKWNKEQIEAAERETAKWWTDELQDAGRKPAEGH